MFSLQSLVIASLLPTQLIAHAIGKRAIPYGTAITTCTVPGVVALTFDDGPWVYTESVLDQLKAGGHRATFFINGNNYDSIYNHNSTVRRQVFIS
jgi:peptidoglycan/xylan/chitin deacetylase (PgdA/CDA1 family)